MHKISAGENKMETTKTVKLGDLCKKVKNGASSFYLKDGTVPLKIIRHADVGEDGIITTASVEQVMARDSPRTADNLLKTGDILVAVRGPAKVAIVPQEAEGYSFSAEFMALELDSEKIRPELVAVYLRLPHVNAYLESKSQARSLRSVSQQDILDLEIRIPSPGDQQKSVELLSLISEQELLIRDEQKKLLDLKLSLLLQVLGGSRP